MMKNKIGKLLRRSKSLRTRDTHQKQLRHELLEGRRLLTVDVPFPYQNDLIHEDVSGDYDVSPLDTLLVVNAINNGMDGALPTVEAGRKADGPLYDVNGDNFLSAIDALMVTNFLNGEGETTPTAVFSYEFVDSTGAPLSSSQVAVGDIFQLKAFVRDTRGFSAAGINAAYLDIAFDNDLSFDVAVGEIQSLKFFVDQLDVSQTSSSFTLSLNGQTTSPIPLFANGAPQSDAAIAANIQVALAALPNVGVGNVTAVVDQAAKAEDQQNNVPRFNFEIRFGNELSGQNLPLLTLDPSNVKVNPGQTFNFAIAEVLAGDQSTPQAEAQAFIFANLYDFARRAEVTSSEFNDVGAASQLIPLPTPASAKLLFTVPLIAKAPGVINFTPNPADNSPSTDIVTGVTVIPTSMVDYGSPFSITVIADPTAPIAINDTLTISEDSSVTLNGNVTANDTVAAGRTLSVFSVAATPTTVGTLNGFTYVPPMNFVGTDTLTYIAQDSSGLQSNIATVTIQVTAVNDPPTASDDMYTVDEDSMDNALNVLMNDSAGPNEPSDSLTIVQVGATSSGGVVTIVAGGGSLLYSPPAGFLGTDTFTYTVRDQGGLEDSATVTITVESAVLPRARADSATTQENTPVSINVLANDSIHPESRAIIVSTTNGSFGAVAIDDNGTPNDTGDDKLTYTPSNPNFFGTDSFTYTLNDTAAQGENSTATVSVTITNVNDPPILVDDQITTTEDTVTTIAVSTLLSNDSPGAGEGAGETPNPQTLTITSVTAISAGGTVVLAGDNVIYTPAKDFNGTFLFTYTAVDNGVPPLSGSATVTITVNPVNDAPIAGHDFAATEEDTPVAIPIATLLSNDSPGPSDEAGQSLMIVGVSPSSAQGGTVAIVGDNVVYSPALNFNGTDTFTYTLSDGDKTAIGTVTVTVAPINDAPIAVTDMVTAYKDQILIIPVGDLLANDSPGPANESSQTLSIVAVAATANTNGTVVLNSNGTITYTPNPGYVGDASFTYTLQDSGPSGGANVNQATGTVLLSVEEFSPSFISGIAWVDETGDGIVDANERRLGGISITLVGTALGRTITPQTVMTLSDGSYSFDNLKPGNYSVRYDTPEFLLDGVDVAGALGDMDDVENQFTIELAAPGGFSASGYQFAMHGLDPHVARTLDQLASRYLVINPSLVYNGAYFGLAADNSLLWSSKLDGFDDAVFTEAVLTNNGTEVLMTYVDDAGNVFTATLGRGDFIKVQDSHGDSVIRVLGSQSKFNWQQVNLQAPPFKADKYLDAVDQIFAQEGW